MTDAPETDASFLAPVSGACVAGISFEVGGKNQEEKWKFIASISQSVCCLFLGHQEY